MYVYIYIYMHTYMQSPLLFVKADVLRLKRFEGLQDFTLEH